MGVPAEQQCGKGVHLDVHVDDNGLGDVVDSSYPAGCGTDLREGAAMLAFFFFDLARCIQKENEPPR